MSFENELALRVVEAIQMSIHTNAAELHEPAFCGNEYLYIKNCLDTSFVSSVGKYVDLFEEELAKYTGSKYVIAVVNGTAALHIALKLAGVQNCDEVLVPTLTFVATANAVSYCGATPHFIDSEDRTLGVDPLKLRSYLLQHTEQRSGHCINVQTKRVIRAIVPMHAFGHPVDMDELLDVASDFNINVVEDAAESLGSFYKGKHTGTIGLLGTLSFNGNKIITSGGGGAILTNNSDLAARAKHITTTAKIPHQWEFLHDEIGFNYRMPNLNAALGCAQLEQLPAKISSKRQLYSRYEEVFKKVDGIRLMREPSECKSNYWLQTLILDAANSKARDTILRYTNKLGIKTRPAWNLISELPPFKKCPAMNLDAAKSLSQRLINIPSSPTLIDKL